MYRLYAILLSFFCLFSCSDNHQHVVKIAVTAVPHAEIIEQISDDLKKDGILLDIIVVEDFNTPNRALHDKEVDLNFFQHIPFLQLQCQEFGYSLDTLCKVHIEPMGLYSKQIKDLKDLKSHASVAIPADPTNQARALLLLEKYGLIQLNAEHLNVTTLNIIKNEKKLQFLEIDSALLPRVLDDVTVAAITTYFALQGNLSPLTDAIGLEDKTSLYSNVVAIRKEENNNEIFLKIKQSLQSEKIKDFLNNHYKGSIAPAF